MTSAARKLNLGKVAIDEALPKINLKSLTLR